VKRRHFGSLARVNCSARESHEFLVSGRNDPRTIRDRHSAACVGVSNRRLSFVNVATSRSVAFLLAATLAAGSAVVSQPASVVVHAYVALLDEAGRLGLSVVGHVPMSVRAADASDAGHKTIEHLSGIIYASSSAEEELMRRNVALSTGGEASKGIDPARRSARRELRERLLNTYDATKAKALFTTFAKNGTWVGDDRGRQARGPRDSRRQPTRQHRQHEEDRRCHRCRPSPAACRAERAARAG
jgi:hypothetical protein